METTDILKVLNYRLHVSLIDSSMAGSNSKSLLLNRPSIDMSGLCRDGLAEHARFLRAVGG